MATAFTAPLTGMTNKLARREDNQPATVKEFFNKLCKDFDRAYTPARLARYYQWARMECYYRGQQLIWYNPQSRQIEYLNEDETELYFINNIILPFIEMISAEYTKSRPRFASFSETGAGSKIRAAQDNADFLMGSWSDTLWTPEELQRESKLIQFRSRVYTRTKWDENLGVWLDMPQFGEQQADMGEGLQGQYQAATGKERKRSGGISSKGIDPFKVKVWDRRYTPEESPYLEYEDFELDALLKKKYSHLNKLPKKSPPDPMSGLAFLRQLETAIGNTGEADAQAGISALYSSYYGDISQQTDDLTSVHSETWFEPYMLNYVTGNQPDDVFGDGSLIIPPRTRLDEVFPEGAKWCKVNGEAVAAYDESKNDEWSGYLFMVTAASHYGVGAENLMAQQEWFTEVGSLIISSAMYGSNGITVADASKIKNGKVLNRPGTIVELEDMIPGVDKLENVIKHLTTSGVDPVLMQMPAFLKESVQLTSGARNSQVSGLPGQGLQTATGVNNMTATADSAAAMKLELRAANLARRMEQALKIWQKRQQYPRYFGRFNETTGRMLRSVDIPYELRVRFEPDSHEPRTNFDKKQDYMGLVTALSQLPEGAPPTLVKAGIRLFVPDLELDEAEAWNTVGQKRLDAVDEIEKQAMAMIQSKGVPEQMAAPFVLQEMLLAAAPDQLLDNHQALVAFYRDFYISDEYMKSSDTKKDAIHQLVMAHEAGGVMEAQKQMAQEVAAQAPAQQAQMEQAAQQKQIEGAGEGEESQMAEQVEAEKAQREEERSGKEREHQSYESEASRRHEQGQTEAQHAHDRDIADREDARAEKQMAHDEKMAKLNKKESKSE